MASHNLATSGANQYNVGISLALTTQHHYHLNARATAVATAQQFGSAIDTKYSYQPLQELIDAVSGDGIVTRRFHGQNVYQKMTGKITNMLGFTEDMSMEHISNQDRESPTSLGTIIVCLSVYFGRAGLGFVLASAIMMYSNGKVDKPMDGTIRILQGNIEKYASAVLGRDGMCNKLENAKEAVRSLAKLRAPHVQLHSMFLPPKSDTEAGDFAEFLTELWLSQADGQKIHTRSVKLFALALLLSEYGWQIDVSTEFMDENRVKAVSVKKDTGALSVIYSTVTTSINGREYVENHSRYLNMRRMDSEYHATATCKAACIGVTTGQTLTKTKDDYNQFMLGYNASTEFYRKHAHFRLDLATDLVQIDIYQLEDQRINSNLPSFLPVLTRVSGLEMQNGLLHIMVSTLCRLYPDYDWNLMLAWMDHQTYPHAPFTTMMDDYTGDAGMLCVTVGVLIGTLDCILLSLVDMTADSLVRVPAHQGVLSYTVACIRLLNDLLSTGVEPGQVVQLCAIRLAGVYPKDSSVLNPTDIKQVVGYWNAQQGLLLSPIAERSLYFDLSRSRSQIVTFFNIPIMGMPTDDRGWIRAGHYSGGIHRRLPLGTALPRRCEVVLEYRPYFEQDHTRLIAAVYLDGVFYNIMPLTGTLSIPEDRRHSQCKHSAADNIPTIEGEYVHIPLGSLEPGELSVPRDGRIALVSPQINNLSRFFSAIAFRSMMPVIQDGCLSCALNTAKKEQSSVIIPSITESDM